MSHSKSRLQRQVRDHKQERRFFIAIGIITAVLILVLYLIYS